MQKRKGGLGRGLGSLIPQGDAAAEPASQVEEQNLAPTEAKGPEPVAENQSGLRQVEISRISPNPHQPRQSLAPEELEELSDSIRAHGVLQPLIVTGAEGGYYTLIAGERRWRASSLAGLTSVPVIVKEASSRDMLELALVENLQRSDLNPLEEAQAYRALVDEFGLKQDEVALRVGKSRGAVANSIRLLKLPALVLEALSDGAITEGHARAILQVPDEGEQLWLLQKIISDGLNVRQVEAYARKLSERPPQEDTGGETKADDDDGGLYNEDRDIEERFRGALGTKVQLYRTSRGGKVTIFFYSEEELARIYGTIVGEDDASP